MDSRERITRARQIVRRDAFQRMLDLGLNQLELADRADVARKTVSRFFNADGWREPAVLHALAVALEWPPDELERRVDTELARQELVELEQRVAGVVVLQLDPSLVAGLTPEEASELRAVLRAVAVQTAATIRARTPGRGFPAMNADYLLTIGA